ncbi:BolA family transcriptional regulator [Tropicimonas sp. IMCC6043]|uniref:BolA family protein n=1 Tax=Tropicimonas sp. IMCC6043 TaxID=2510645 RepID=UPI00101DEF7D|nr:BolA family protein [Tropicimonas sp. IMCC6043]RYH07670.1 BolA family transcriptional regulator [Tropicimonas sp. IMCC6043]
MTVTEEITQKLTERFSPSAIEVIDESEKHRGHSGFREGGETHFHVMLRSAEFDGLSRVARHRAVHASLGSDLVGRIHALSLDLAP